jgi:hypothetical protein
LVETQKKVISYQGSQYPLILEVISSPILKEIVISAPYVIHNKTAFNMVLNMGEAMFEVAPDHKVAIPFTTEMNSESIFGLNFPHLPEPTENYKFTLRDIELGYDHSIMYGDSQLFNCLVHLTKVQEQTITVSPLTSFVNLLPLDLKL